MNLLGARDTDGERVADGPLTTSGEPRASQMSYLRTERSSESNAFRKQTTQLLLRAAQCKTQELSDHRKSPIVGTDKEIKCLTWLFWWTHTSVDVLYVSYAGVSSTTAQSLLGPENRNKWQRVLVLSYECHYHFIFESFLNRFNCFYLCPRYIINHKMQKVILLYLHSPLYNQFYF